MVQGSTRRWASLLTAAAVVAVLAACGGASERELIDSAKGYLEKKDPKAAVVQLKVALQGHPNSGEARFLLGKTLLEEGDPVAAAVELQKAMDLQFDDNEVFPVLARALLQQGQPKKVVDLFGRATLQDRQAIADLKTSVATAQLQLGARDRADAAVLDALNASPDHAPALLLKARLVGAGGDLQQALTIIDQVLAKNPRNVDALIMKGSVQATTEHKPDAAIATFRSALAIDPRNMQAHVAIITMMLRQFDSKGFEAQVAALAKALPGQPQTIFYQAQALLARGDLSKARELIQGVLRVLPDNVYVLQLAGAIELQAHQPLLAEQYLQKSLTLAPGLRLARRLLAQTYLRSGQADKALAVLEPTLADPQADSDSLALAAEGQLLKGEVRLAEQLFVRAAKVNPKDTKVRTALALTRLSKGDGELAFTELESIAASDTSAYADMALISARMRRGNFAQALLAIDALDRKQPGKAFVANLRGRVQLQLRQTAAARAAFTHALELEPSYLPAAASLASLDMDDKRPDLALQRFEGVLKADPKNSGALLAIADLKERQGAPGADVLKLVVEASRLNPAEPGPRLALLNYFMTRQEYKKAVTAAQEAVVAIPSDPRLLVLLGQAHFGAGEREQALSTFGKLVNLFPGNPDAYLRLADVQLAMKDPQSAEQTLSGLLDRAPDNLDAQRALTAIAIGADHDSLALKTARSVQQQRPKQGIGWELEGDAHAHFKRWDAAQKAYEESLRREALPPVAVKAYTAMLAGGQAAAAQSFSMQWLKDHPRDTVFLWHLAQDANAGGDLATAERWYRAVLAIQPDNAAVLNNLAEVLLGQGKPGAAAFAEKANRLVPNRPALMDTWATALAAERQFDRAIEIQRRAVQALPAHPGLHLSLAKIYLQAGNHKDEARKELETVKASGDKFPSYAEAVKLLATL